jgi:hypothetical protein
LAAALIRVGVGVPAAAAVVIALMAGPEAALLVRRRRRARDTALVVEDQLPTEINPLRLNND